MSEFKILYVYILLCADGTYYTGVTNNLERRLMQHQTGYNRESYTFSRRPVELIYFEMFNNYLQAIEWESRIKKWSSKKKKALAEGDWIELRNESECKNSTSHKLYKKPEFDKNN